MKKVLTLAVTAAAVAYYAYNKLIEASQNAPKNKPSIPSVDFDIKDTSEEIKAEVEKNNDSNLIDESAMEPETEVQQVTPNAIDVEPELEVVEEPTSEKLTVSVSANEEINQMEVEELLEKVKNNSLEATKQQEKEEIEYLKKEFLESPIDQKRKLLELKIDLQVADYDEGIYLVTQKIIYQDGSLLNELIQDINKYDYYLDQNEKGEMLIKRKITNKAQIKPCILALYDRVREDNQIYQNFQIEAIE